MINDFVQRKVWNQFKEFLVIPFRKRKNFERAKILLLCFIFLLGETIWMLDSSLLVLYTKDKFDWSQKEMMEYNTYNFLLIVFGQFICFPVLVKFLQMPPMLIGCLACISRGGYYSMLSVCQEYVVNNL